MVKHVIGIDPGQKTGLARFEDGNLKYLYTLTPQATLDMLASIPASALVVLEDSTLQSKVFIPHEHMSRAAALKVARNIGEIDGLCRIIKGMCEANDIRVLSISPKDKGRKQDATDFSALTGWGGRSNQHERDAALVAWRYRFGFTGGA